MADQQSDEISPTGGKLLTRLRDVHKQLHEGMTKLEEKNYPEAMQTLLIVDKLMLALIQDAGGLIP